LRKSFRRAGQIAAQVRDGKKEDHAGHKKCLRMPEVLDLGKHPQAAVRGNRGMGIDNSRRTNYKLGWSAECNLATKGRA